MDTKTFQHAASSTILVVDDTIISLKLLTKIIADNGYKVRTAIDGKFALETVLAEPPDLILLDLKMPQIDGYEVCRRLKSNERTRDIPVIFVSGLDEPDDILRAFDCGGVDYITKPFQPVEVLARVRTHLSLRVLQIQLETRNSQLQQEIAERDKIQQESNRLVLELQKALENIKTLGGMLPICASCKKIRDDEGYWNRVEDYLSKHSDVLFTHGLCPECLEKAFTELEESNISGTDRQLR